MEIKIGRDILLKGISRVQGILEKRSHMPILSTVLLATKENELEISATDLEIGFQDSYPVEIIQPGSITISGKKLLDITRETDSKKIYISEKENNWIYKILFPGLTEGKITRHGDGEEIREYIHVRDAAKLSVKILSKEYKNQNIIITCLTITMIHSLGFGLNPSLNVPSVF